MPKGVKKASSAVGFKHFRPRESATIEALQLGSAFSFSGVDYSAGDYFVKDEGGNLQPMPKDQFEAKYEEVKQRQTRKPKVVGGEQAQAEAA